MRKTFSLTLFTVPALELSCFIAAVAVVQVSMLLAIFLTLLSALVLSFALHISYHEAAHRCGKWPLAKRLIVGAGLTILLGLSFHGYRIGHFNHHRFDNRIGDFTSTWRLVDGKPVPWRPLPYCLTWTRAFFEWPRLARSALEHGDARVGTLIVVGIESLIPLAIFIALWLLMPTAALLYAFLIYVGWALVSLHNYGQHPPIDYISGLEATSYSAPLYNLVTFNNGLHYEHHKKPGIPIADLEPDADAPQVDTNHMLAPFLGEAKAPAARR